MAKKQFKAESKRLLDLMINSIYTHKEIFLRELISNASDALDKRYFSSLQAGGGLDRSEYEIRIEPNEQQRTLTVTDNGCGMDKDELEQNLGTIAKSGTRAFKEQNGDAADLDVIGQFGVGFYSAFMVSDNIKVYSHKDGCDAYLWESFGQDGYTVTLCEYAPIGTKIVLSIKQDADDNDYSQFLKPYRLEALVKKYSDYVRYPIRMQMEKSVPGKDSTDEKPTYETVTEDTTLNSMVPIWRKQKSEITDEEYHAYYRDTFHDFEEPLSVLHIRTEGMLSYDALLYIPKKAPFDYFTKGFKRGLKLYANGVMIMDACEELLPEYFGFVRGLVDSPDLSLNISREMLQHDRQLSAIANNLKKKIQQELLRLMKEEREKYETFFTAFGISLKYGVYADYGMNKEMLKDLLIYRSARQDKNISLQEYVDGMLENQTEIYYAAGDSLAMVQKLPQTEKVLDKGYDILCMTDDVDEFAVRILNDYAGKPLRSVADAELDLSTEDEKKEMDKKREQNAALLDRIKAALDGKASGVRLTQKLKTAVACLSGEGGLSVEMYKVLKSMPAGGAMEEHFVLELNPDHPVFAKLADMDDEQLKIYADLIYQQALLMAGLPLEDPAAFSEAICRLM